MKKVLSYIAVLLTALLVMVGVPLLILVGNGNCKMYVEDFLAFTGSYWGGILGGICTLVGVLITLKFSQAESMKPMLVIKFSEDKVLIRNPEDYSEVNKVNGFINYASLPSISDLCKIKLLNSGKGNAKNINITILVRANDAFLTDNNLRFLNNNRLPDEQVKLINRNYVQKAYRTYIKQDGGKCSFPINIAMNGIVLSSIWNISHVFDLDENNFKSSIDMYYKKISTLSMEIPEMFILLEYSDLNDKKYHSLFRLGFALMAHQLGVGVIIKPLLYYEKDSKIIELKKEMKEREKKIDKISIREKYRLKKLKIWQGIIYESAMEMGLTDTEANTICHDSSLRRYFFNYLRNGIATKKELMVIFIYCCLDNNIELGYSEEIMDKILKIRRKLVDNKKIRFYRKKDKTVSCGQIKDEMKIVVENVEELYKVYFNLFAQSSNLNTIDVMISAPKFSVKIPIRKDLITECGFYRLGYSYRLVESQELIQSVIQHNYDNIERGFLDEKGIYFSGQTKWECIYLR